MAEPSGCKRKQIGHGACEITLDSFDDFPPPNHEEFNETRRYVGADSAARIGRWNRP